MHRAGHDVCCSNLSRKLPRWRGTPVSRAGSMNRSSPRRCGPDSAPSRISISKRLVDTADEPEVLARHVRHPLLRSAVRGTHRFGEVVISVISNDTGASAHEASEMLAQAVAGFCPNKERHLL